MPLCNHNRWLQTHRIPPLSALGVVIPKVERIMLKDKTLTSSSQTALNEF